MTPKRGVANPLFDPCDFVVSLRGRKTLHTGSYGYGFVRIACLGGAEHDAVAEREFIKTGYCPEHMELVFGSVT